MTDSVLLEIDAAVATLTLNQPDRRNPLPFLPEHGFIKKLDDLKNNAEVRAVIVTGNGKAFCSGMDLKGLQALQAATPAQNLEDSEKLRDFFEAVRTFPKPLIAAVNGPAVGGGAGLVLVSDFVIMEENAWLQFSEVKLGFLPALVSAYLVPTVGVKTAKRLLLSAQRISSPLALQLGLADQATSQTNLLKTAKDLAMGLSQNGPAAMQATKTLIGEIADKTVADGLQLAVKKNAAIRETPECKEGVKAFLDKRKPNWQD